jgi:APA family basic amino acid/polyamine antiporter
VPIRRPTHTYEVPIVGVLGLLFLVAVLVMVVITNQVGRVAGPAWVVVGVVVYSIYRRHRGLPILQSIERNWPEQQLEVYEESGESGLAEEYRAALKRRDRMLRGRNGPGRPPLR